MFGLSRAWLFGIGTAIAVFMVALLAWRVLDQKASQGPAAHSMDATGTKSSTALSISPAEPALSASTAASGALLAPSAPVSGDEASTASGPKFDIVRVEPNGETVIAGRAAPNSLVRLLDGDKVVAEVKTDANGQFALIPPVLGGGDHLLSLKQDGQPAATVQQTVAVAVPSGGKGEVVVALAEPGAATRILSDKSAAPEGASKAAPPRELSIRTVEAEDTGGFYATGLGIPGSTIRLSLNGAAVATVQASEDGRWSLKVERGMAAGAYAVRADQVGVDGKVVSRAEVPFDYPGRRQVASAGPATAPGIAPPVGPDAVVGDLQSVTVQRGDSLWRISRKMLGSGMRYTQIYTANNNVIRDPSRIFPKQILVVPSATK
jgi:nucleoid-associated protein YgaU